MEVIEKVHLDCNADSEEVQDMTDGNDYIISLIKKSSSHVGG